MLKVAGGLLAGVVLVAVGFGLFVLFGYLQGRGRQ